MLKIEDVVDSQKTVYIAGAISDDKNYKQKFRKAEEYLRSIGFERIINPTCVPDNLPYKSYAPISISFVQVSDIVYMLKDYGKSIGALAELSYAIMSGKLIFLEESEGAEYAVVP